MLNAIAYILCVLIWGSTWYVIEFQVGDVPPQWSVAYRFILAFIIMLLISLFKGKPILLKGAIHRRLFILGLCLFSTNYLLIYIGTGYITSGLVAVCFSMIAFFNIFNGRLFLKAPVGREIILGAVLGMIGLILIFLPEFNSLSLQDISFENSTLLGITICLLGAFCASLGNTAAASKKLADLPLLSVNTWGMFYGALINIGYALLSGQPAKFLWTPEYVISMLVLAILGTVVAFQLYLWLIARIGMAKAAYTAILIPLVALTISTLFEGYIWTTEAIFGLIAILAGNVIMIKYKKKQPHPPLASEAEQIQS